MRARRDPRCAECRLLAAHCICARLAPVETETRITIIAHEKEWTKPTGSGHLAARLLPTAEMIRRLESRDGAWRRPGHRALLLFPERAGPGREAAPPLEAVIERLDRPLQLVVPDGTFRQASRMCLREPLLLALPRARVEGGRAIADRLRAHPDPTRLGTLEAIARALGALEGPAVEDQLLSALALFSAAIARARRGDNLADAH